MNETAKKKFNYGVLVAPVLAIGVIVYYFYSDPDIKNLGSIISNFNLLLLFGCFICFVFNVLSQGAILMVGLSLFPGEMKYKHAVKAALIGFYYSALTPFSSGGQPMQVAYMRRWKVPTSASSSIMVIDFFLWHICSLVMTTIAFITYRSLIVNKVGLLIGCILGMLISLVCILGATLILFNIDFRPFILFFVKLLKKLRIVKHEEKVDHVINKWMDDFKDAFVVLKKFPFAIIKMMVFTIARMFFYVAITYVIYRGLGLYEMSLFDVILIQVLVNSAVAFVPIPGASGASEGVFYVLFSTIFKGGTTLPAMLLWRAFTYYIFVFVGAAMNIFDGIRDFRLRFSQRKKSLDI